MRAVGDIFSFIFAAVLLDQLLDFTYTSVNAIHCRPVKPCMINRRCFLPGMFPLAAMTKPESELASASVAFVAGSADDGAMAWMPG